MKRIAVFPGSFDPITIGHEDIVKRALVLFDTVIVAIGTNSSKQTRYTLDERLDHISSVFKDHPAVEVDTFQGLTVDYCEQKGAQFILRGMRTPGDFEYERSIGMMNKAMKDHIETVFLLSRPAYSAISSTIVRDILRHGGNAEQFLPGALSL